MVVVIVVVVVVVVDVIVVNFNVQMKLSQTVICNNSSIVRECTNKRFKKLAPPTNHR